MVRRLTGQSEPTARRPGRAGATALGAHSATRSVLPLQLAGRARREATVVQPEQVQRGLRDEHDVTGLAGHLLDAGGGVDGVADHRELDPPAAADRAGHHRARVHPDPDLEPALVVAANRARRRPARRDRALGVIGEQVRGPEHGQQPVADELVRVAAVPREDGNDELVEGVELGHDLARALACSANAVKSRMSRNSIVTSTSSPPSMVPSPITRSASAGATNAAERPAQAIVFALRPTTISLNEPASEPVSSAQHGHPAE